MIKVILLSLLVASQAFAAGPIVMGGSGGSSAAAIDYTADASCKGAWPMDVNDGNELDVSGEDDTLIQSAGDTIPTDVDDPWTGDGVSRLFTAANAEFLYHADGLGTDVTGTFSICVWIKPTGNADDMVPVGKWVEAGDQRSYLIKYDGNGTDQIEFRLSDDGEAPYTTAKSTASISDTDWHHICVVYNAFWLVVYLDTVAGATENHSSGAFNSTAEFIVGQYDTNNYFDGPIDDLIIFNRPISAGEVLNIYTYGADGSE